MNYSLIIIAVILVVLLIKLFKAPFKFVWKIIINAVSGLLTLLVFNFVAGFFGTSIDIIFINCLISGVLGIPGVILILLFR